MRTAPPTPKRRKPARLAHRAAGWVESVLFALLFRRRIRALLAQLEALFTAWQNGTLPPAPAPRPNPARASASPAPRAPRQAMPTARTPGLRPQSHAQGAPQPAPAMAPKRHRMPPPRPPRALRRAVRRLQISPWAKHHSEKSPWAIAPNHAYFVAIS